MPFPGYASVGGEIEDMAFLCKATSLPAMNIGNIDVKFRGRDIKIAGDRTIGEWPITCYNDTNFKLRNAFERWQNGINNMSDNEGFTNPADYQADAFVYQLDRDGSVLRKYKFHDVFPTNIGQIDLSYDSSDTIEEFTVELQVQWWTAAAGEGGAGSGAGDIN